jgi:hypothetical protein
MRNVLVLMLATAVLRGQSVGSPEDLARKLRDATALSPEKQPLAIADPIVRYIHELAWPVASRIAGRQVSEPAIEVVMRPSDEGPFIDRGRIVFPAVFLFQAFSFGLLLSHDVWILNGNVFPVLDPVLQRPHATSPLLPLLDLKQLPVENTAWVGLNSTTNCWGRNPACAQFQTGVLTAVIAFALAHEYAHVVNGQGDSGVHSYSLQTEKDADAWALRFLAEFRRGSQVALEMRAAMDAAPAAFLRFRSAISGTPGDDLNQRADAMAGRLIRDARRLHDRLFDSLRSESGLGRLRIAFQQEPLTIVLNGQTLDPAGIRGKDLPVRSGVHHLLAVFPGGIACIQPVVAAGSLEQAAVVPVPFSTANPDRSEMDAFSDQRRWGDVLARTSDSQLRLRNRSFAYDHAQALHECGAASVIDASTLPAGLDADDLRQVGRWMRSGKVLHTWLQ